MAIAIKKHSETLAYSYNLNDQEAEVGRSAWNTQWVSCQIWATQNNEKTI